MISGGGGGGGGGGGVKMIQIFKNGLKKINYFLLVWS